MKRTLLLVGALAVAAVAAALTYLTVAHAAEYRALLARGDRALREDQTFAAIEAYSGALTLRPDSMVAHLRRGEMYQRRGDVDAAARDFRAAADLDPTVPQPLEALGDVLYQREWFSRAAATYESYLRLNDRSARVTYKLALTRYRSGDRTGAVQALTQAVKLDERLAEAHYLLGICLREANDTAAAQQQLERAAALSPALLGVREELADLYESIGRRADALVQLQVLAGLDRAHVERQVALGLAQARAGHPDLAVLTLGSALERAPDQPLVYTALGRVWLDVAAARRDPVALSKAIEALARVAAGNDPTSEALTLYGRALLLRNQAELAARTLDLALQRFPVDPDAYLARATVARRLGDRATAERVMVAYAAVATRPPPKP